MGQYYTPVLKNEVGTTEVFNLQVTFKDPSKEHWNGFKLMEHSWWENSFCKAFSEKLLTPKRVAWVGDYAEEEELLNIEFPTELDNGRKIDESSFSLDNVKYLINHDHKTYIDLASYKMKSYSGGWIIYPVSLLTAVGNDRGGGDYHEGGTCYEDVGSWAGCLIQLSNEVPINYELLDIFFVEK